MGVQRRIYIVDLSLLSVPQVRLEKGGARGRGGGGGLKCWLKRGVSRLIIEAVVGGVRVRNERSAY